MKEAFILELKREMLTRRDSPADEQTWLLLSLLSMLPFLLSILIWKVLRDSPACLLDGDSAVCDGGRREAICIGGICCPRQWNCREVCLLVFSKAGSRQVDEVWLTEGSFLS